MTDRPAASDIELDSRAARGKRVFMYAAFAMLLFFLLSLLNFVLAGGRMGLRDTTRWDETVAWPFIPLPAFVVIATGVAAAVGVFMAVQWFKHFRRRDVFSVVGCMCLVMSGLFFIVYDSLDSPLFILMLAIGLMNRERLQDQVVGSGLAKVDVAVGPRMLGRAR